MARICGDWLTKYLEYTQYSEAPDTFHLWTGIGVIAGALRRKVYIDMGYFTWFPNFYICFVAPPGIISKSTTADIGMRLLRQIEGIHFGPSSVTWQSLVATLAQSAEQINVTGTGPGALSLDSQLVPMSAMTVVASELGTFLDPDDRKSIDTLVALWDCPDSFGKSTKLDGLEEISNAWFQLIGCTTPSWIAENMNNYFIGGGFASRTIFIYGDTKRQLVAYPQLKIPESHQRLAQDLIVDLNQIALMNGAYEITPEALAWGDAWYEEHYSIENPLRRDPRFGGYFARKQTHVHKLAMVKAASERNNLSIIRSDIEWAAERITELEHSMMRVFGEMNKEDVVGVQQLLLQKIAGYGRVRKDALYRECMNLIGFETFDAAMNGLYAAAAVIMETNGSTTSLVVTAEGLKSLDQLADPRQARAATSASRSLSPAPPSADCPA